MARFRLVAILLPLLALNFTQACDSDCCSCITGGGGSACESRCTSCSSDCQTCVEYGGGTGCIDDGRCDCSGSDDFSPSDDGGSGGGCFTMKSITSSQLECVFPKLSSSSASSYTTSMNKMMSGLTTTSCDWAAFLGNVGTESDQLTTWTQNPCDSATDAPYCGRGPLQITFSSNYEYCAEQTSYCACPTIYSDPELVSTDTNTGFGTAACVWGILSGHDLSKDADGTLEGFKATACYINAGHYPCGDPNGWASRQSYWYQANSCLGIDEAHWREDFVAFNKTYGSAVFNELKDAVPTLLRGSSKPSAPEVKNGASNSTKFRAFSSGSTCTGPGEFCCGAPGGDVNNCPASAQTDDCTAINDCCCG